MKFDTKLVETEKGCDQLAQEIAESLDRDQSDPLHDRDNWLGEKDLRDFESVVVQKLGLYQIFAYICQMAYRFSGIESVRALFLLGQINGSRRLPYGDRPDGIITQLFAQSREKIEKLDESPRKTRLNSLWSYHAGIYAREIGNFKLAAESQEQSADFAEKSGDIRSAVISCFCGYVDSVNQALIYGACCVGHLVGLRITRNRLNGVLGQTGDPTDIRWLYLNCPYGMLISHFLGGRTYDSTEEFRRLCELDKQDSVLAEAHKSSIGIAFAIHALNQMDFRNSKSMAEAIILDEDSSVTPEQLAIAHLIIKKVADWRILLEKDQGVIKGLMEDSKQHLKAAHDVVDKPLHVGVFVERLFNGLPA